MNRNIEDLLKEWEIIRNLTLDLLKEIPEEHLTYTVSKNMGTIGKQFRHIGDVQICYNEAIKAGEIDFNKYRKDYSLEKSKKKLKKFLEDVNNEMLKLIEENQDAKISWFGEDWDLNQHIKSLIEHEILHHGELIVYIRSLDLNFPKSWELWGL